MADSTFLWHDYETFGRVPRRDRPAQFAGIRTDAQLQEIGAPVMFHCQPAPDYLPDPESCLLTGILPQHCLEQGLPEHAFARAIETAREDKIAAQQYLAGIVLHIVGKILSLSKNNQYENSDTYQKIEQAKIMMQENIYKEITPEEIADRLNISYSWFRKQFKAYTGYAPAQYFQELKINKAKYLLSETTLPVKDIAYQLNFNSTEYFFSIFKRKTRHTPSEYRNHTVD